MEKVNIGAVDNLLKNRKPPKIFIYTGNFKGSLVKSCKIYIQQENPGDVVGNIKGDITYKIIQSPDTIPLNVTTKNGKIILVTKQIFDNKDEFQYFNYHLNGKLKTKIKSSSADKKITNSTLGVISLPILLNRLQSFDNRDNLLSEVNFDNEYKFKLDNVVKYCEANLEGCDQITIKMTYYDNSLKEARFYTGEITDSKQNYPYWVILYGDYYDRWTYTGYILMDGNTGNILDRDGGFVR